VQFGCRHGRRRFQRATLFSGEALQVK
jgi:hypothetical protein